MSRLFLVPFVFYPWGRGQADVRAWISNVGSLGECPPTCPQEGKGPVTMATLLMCFRQSINYADCGFDGRISLTGLQKIQCHSSQSPSYFVFDWFNMLSAVMMENINDDPLSVMRVHFSSEIKEECEMKMGYQTLDLSRDCGVDVDAISKTMTFSKMTSGQTTWDISWKEMKKRIPHQNHLAVVTTTDRELCGGEPIGVSLDNMKFSFLFWSSYTSMNARLEHVYTKFSATNSSDD